MRRLAVAFVAGLVAVAACDGGNRGDPTIFAGTYDGTISWQRTFATDPGGAASFEAPTSVRVTLCATGDCNLVAIGVCGAVDDVLDDNPINLIFDPVGEDELRPWEHEDPCSYYVAGNRYSGTIDRDSSFGLLEGNYLRLQILATLEDDTTGDRGVLTADFTGTR